MSKVQAGLNVIRRAFGRIRDAVSVPNLIEVQSKSFNDFVQLDCLPKERKPVGLEKVLQDIFPIEYDNKLSLEYISYELGNWSCMCGQLTGIENRWAREKKGSDLYKTCLSCYSRVMVKMPMTLEECRLNGKTYAMPLKVKVQLVSWADDESGARVVRDIKEQEIFFADIPVMADLYELDGRFRLGRLGTFLINGVDRVVVSQLHRSSGVVFSQSKKVKDVRGRPHYLARLIPMRGSWIDFEFDSSDILYMRMDKRKKILVTTFLQALGFKREEIIPLFYRSDEVHSKKGSYYLTLNDSLLGTRIERGMLPEKIEKRFVGRRITKEVLAALKKEKVSFFTLSHTKLLGRFIAQDVIDEKTGEVLFEQGGVFNEGHLALLQKYSEVTFYLVQTAGYSFQPTLALTLNNDKCHSQEDALKEFHTKVWPGDSSSLKEVLNRLNDLLFNPRFYDLTRVGRIRINRKLGLKTPEDVLVLTKEDIVSTVKYLVNLRERGEGELDDIDHLGNRRVRLVGELLNNQMYVGFARIERIVRERFRMHEANSALMPQDFLNVKPLSAVIREFFGLGQLSQFMDQTNPLAEIAHKRRLSALGPGGVVKDRATFEVRDVHTSHYGRICPIETPEGQTVGLISALATYALVNDLGFIETPYHRVKSGKISDEVVFLDAFDELGYYIAQADGVDEKDSKKLRDGKVHARFNGNFVRVDRSKIDLIDLSPKQVVSVSAALIPFLEHDDAVRALMGSNMQRQAVPLIKTETPIVATGMEREIAKASCSMLTARRPGAVVYVSSDKILVRVDDEAIPEGVSMFSSGIDSYPLKKFKRSSYSTWIHHQPVVSVGDRVEVGSVLTTGPSINSGELSLGSNLLVAFMPWHGFNFEDAIVLNKRLVADDIFTSVHVEEYVADARDTKLGPEEISRDLPNISESILSHLDEDGIVRIGTRVKPGDILVGKVTLKGDVQYSPEEKLLRAIFGEKSREVRDTSMRVPPGVEGTIVDIKILSRVGARRDKRYKFEVEKQMEKVERDFTHHVYELQGILKRKIAQAVVGKAPAVKKDNVLLKKNVFDEQAIIDASFADVITLRTKDKKVGDAVAELIRLYENQVHVLTALQEEETRRLRKGDSLPTGVIKIVKVFIAMKRAISAGDKLAGRHGNKGVVSIIVPREDMPYLEDGRAVDIVLNPLGIPSRMNVGQILETMLGFIGTKLGDGMKEVLEQKSSTAIQTYLEKCYEKEFITSYKKAHGKEGILALAQKTATSGVKFETPVFDSADFEKDLVPLMKHANMPESGSFRLRDGRSGEYFDQDVTVGKMYILKLNHMVDDKLHARSVGPYSLVTQQPLGGKAQHGGQRLGEMEVWALEAYGAAYTLREMLTYKSDDVAGRHKVYQSIVRSEKIAAPGVPESFNVLVKELQGLGLQVDLLKVGKENTSE